MMRGALMGRTGVPLPPTAANAAYLRTVSSGVTGGRVGAAAARTNRDGTCMRLPVGRVVIFGAADRAAAPAITASGIPFLLTSPV